MNGPPGDEPGDLWISSQLQASAAGVHCMCSAASCGCRLDTAERKRRNSVCDDNGDCKGGLWIGECVCVHTLKHKDESAEGGGVVLALRGEKCGFIHIKGSCLRPIPTLDLPRCVSVCVSAPGKPGIDIQLSTELIQVSTGDRRASQHHKSFHRR